jgi:hypothetical protein
VVVLIKELELPDRSPRLSEPGGEQHLGRKLIIENGVRAVGGLPSVDELVLERLRGFQPDAQLRKLVLDAITSQAGEQSDHAARSSELTDQLRRLQDLYVLGDLTKAQYVMRRQALQDEIERLAPPADPQLPRPSGCCRTSPPSGKPRPRPSSAIAY